MFEVVNSGPSNANTPVFIPRGRIAMPAARWQRALIPRTTRLSQTAVYRPVDVELSDYQTKSGLQTRRNNRSGAHVLEVNSMFDETRRPLRMDIFHEASIGRNELIAHGAVSSDRSQESTVVGEPIWTCNA